MTERIWVCLMLVLGLAVGNMRGPGPEPASAKTCQQRAKAKLEAARMTFEALWRNNDYPDVEIAYRWSARWLQAQGELGDTKGGWIGACQAHRQRMRELARITSRLFDSKLVSMDQVRATGYFVAEAEVLLVQAKHYSRELQKSFRKWE
jgi:hypothetical protein